MANPYLALPRADGWEGYWIDSFGQLVEAVVDAEPVACDTDGKPDFLALRQPHPNLCMWCFDLLAIAGRDIREQPLSHRREQLRELLIATDDDRLRFSEEFPDPVSFSRSLKKWVWKA